MKSYDTSRQIPARPEQVFAAFTASERLARWWGPAGFTNTFQTCDFKNGGRWSLVMHGPDGRNYPNESVFAAIVPAKNVVIQHVSEPKFRLTITLTPSAAGTLLSWSQAFENEELGRSIEPIIVPANEQNLDRLTAEVLRQPAR